ncbi:MAG: type II toxin-antitoxin system HicA family toxin [Verrucomicrobiae bacterium]|nr:type II toxin-antitoxin system HicA family toxin [Verrucomicrobiae bacterium]
MCDILTEDGFVCVHQRGNHIVMQKRTVDSTITVPVPIHREVRAGTLLSIICQSGLPREQFIR